MANEGSESDKDFAWIFSLQGFVIAIRGTQEFFRSPSSRLSAIFWNHNQYNSDLRPELLILLVNLETLDRHTYEIPPLLNI